VVDALSAGLLCYCRAGFEPELAAELGQRAASAGFGGHARTDRSSGFVVFSGVDGASLARALPWRELIFARQDMAYPIVAPPGTPPERVTALRQAFEAVMKDPEFLADAKKQHLETALMRGEEIERLIDRIFASPPDVIARAANAIEAGKGVTTDKK